MSIGRKSSAELLQDVLSRIVAARETCEPAERDQILADLEDDLASWIRGWPA